MNNQYALRNTHYALRCFTLLFALLLTLLSACAPQTMSGERMAQANGLYESGAYAEAIAAYQTLVDIGVDDGALYYNLGNATFKAGDLGRAILNYRRAQRRLPRDADVAANLRLARAQTQDRLEPEESATVVQLIEHLLVDWTTRDEIAALTLALWIIWCGLLVLALMTRRQQRGRRVIRTLLVMVGVLLLLSVLSLGIRMWSARGPTPAVIVAESIEVRSGPGADYLTEFTLHAGAEVRIIETRGQWARIALPGELQGWAPEAAVEGL